MYANYHTHTSRCRHAGGTDEAYVAAAVKAGFSILGFSDHSPWPTPEGNTGTVRMDVSELPGYVASVRKLQETYQNKIEMHLGLECEYFPQYFDWLKEQKETFGLEYFILGNHYKDNVHGLYFGNCMGKQDLEDFVSRCISGMESGMYLYLAHPDLMFRSYHVFDEDAKAASRELCRAMHKEHFLMEYNLQGFRNRKSRPDGLGYPTPGFWEIAREEDCRVIVGIDAHNPKDFNDSGSVDEAFSFLQNLGFSVEETLPLRS